MKLGTREMLPRDAEELQRVPEITLVHNCRTRFVELDLAIISRFAKVRELALTSRRPEFVRVSKALRGSDLVVCWFASWHSFLPTMLGRLLGKPVIVIAGGYDVARQPDIAYGHQRGGWRMAMSRAVLRGASVVAAFSRFSAEEAVNNAGVPPSKVMTIYLGVPDTCGPSALGSKCRSVLTVANVSYSNMSRKGLKLFAEASSLLPTVPFVLAGRILDGSADDLRKLGRENLHLRGWLPRSELNTLMKESSVYVQASAHEGFGLAVAEAMLAGCIPVVSGAGSLPEVAGGCGVTISHPSPKSLAEGIEKTLELPLRVRERCRSRILDKFPMRKREEAFRDLVLSLLRIDRRSTFEDETDQAQRSGSLTVC